MAPKLHTPKTNHLCTNKHLIQSIFVSIYFHDLFLLYFRSLHSTYIPKIYYCTKYQRNNPKNENEKKNHPPVDQRVLPNQTWIVHRITLLEHWISLLDNAPLLWHLLNYNYLIKKIDWEAWHRVYYSSNHLNQITKKEKVIISKIEEWAWHALWYYATPFSCEIFLQKICCTPIPITNL